MNQLPNHFHTKIHYQTWRFGAVRINYILPDNAIWLSKQSVNATSFCIDRIIDSHIEYSEQSCLTSITLINISTRQSRRRVFPCGNTFRLLGTQVLYHCIGSFKSWYNSCNVRMLVWHCCAKRRICTTIVHYCVERTLMN